MNLMQRLSLQRRFRSPGALAAFGAFAAPEPLGAIMIVCAAVWWWQARKRKLLPRLLERVNKGKIPDAAATRWQEFSAPGS